MGCTPTAEYRIAPEWRRSCWYVICCSPVLAAVAGWTMWYTRDSEAGGLAFGGIFLLVAAGCAVPLRWKLHLDEVGLARRGLFGWDLWTWDDFASGRVCKQHPYLFVAPERPWWRRRLDLGNMALGDIQEVLAAINAHYQLPPPPVLPEKLAIKYGNFCRRRAVFDRNGIEISVRGVPKTYLWQDIQQVYITRMDPLRLDFKTLQIELPDQEIELTRQGVEPRWRGATAEEINEFLLRHVPPNNVDTHVEGKPLTSRGHIERKLRKAEKDVREWKKGVAVGVPIIAGACFWIGLAGGSVKTACIGALSAVIFVPILALPSRQQRKQVDELKRLLAVATEGEKPPAA